MEYASNDNEMVELVILYYFYDKITNFSPYIVKLGVVLLICASEKCNGNDSVMMKMLLLYGAYDEVPNVSPL
jgi:hypothetical protein